MKNACRAFRRAAALRREEGGTKPLRRLFPYASAGLATMNR